MNAPVTATTTVANANAGMVNGFDLANLGGLPAADQALIARRQALLGPSYRLFYEHPVHPVRGEGVWLYDADGNAFLDAYNNVPSVGHCHPRVVEAIARQAATLNTHTRYLGEAVLEYSERLLATFPDTLNHVMYTCTGSEAVDLALRVARYVTGGDGVIVTENAYHGVTTAAAAISPSLGASVMLGHNIITIPAPDAYHAPGVDVGARMAADVEAAIAFLKRRGVKTAAFIADSIFSTDGVLSGPEGFLKPVIEAVHKGGALYIADEVQPGFGRTGAGMWGFARHGITPDLVVMGKPMGNGMPIAAMVTRHDLVEQFGTNIRYFNTFGANHVSIAAATAVLDVIRDEKLIDNCATMGGYMMNGLRALQADNPMIGDVRGAGLFIGLEFVTDPETRAPDAGLAIAVVNGMRDRRILISASGKNGNSLKIRPPMPFGKDHADLFLNTFADVLKDCRKQAGQ